MHSPRDTRIRPRSTQPVTRRVGDAAARVPILCGVAEPSAAQLRNQLDGVTLRDAARLGRRLKNLRDASPEKLRQLADQVAAAHAVVAARQAAVPTITYP